MSRADCFAEGALSGPDAREPDRLLREQLDRLDLKQLGESVNHEAQARGVSFGSAGGEQAFRIDPVPRILDASTWSGISAGVAQRVRALELFTRDVYGERRIVNAGLISAEAITGADHYEPLLTGIAEQVRCWITLAGLDLVRDHDGSFKVLEDNLRTPSGIAYAVATREIVSEHLTPPEALRVRPLEDAFQRLGEALRAAALPSAGDDPLVVLLSDGESNSAFYEHVTIAERLKLSIVRRADLEVRQGRLFARTAEGERAVDVVYRRTDEDRLSDEHGEPTWLAKLLLEPLREGTLACVNAFGTGVADDKLLHAYVEDMIDFYLHEEPLLRSVATYDPAQPGMLEMILERIGELVIKPRSGSGGYGVLIGPHANREDIERTAAAVATAPQGYIAQEMIMISTHPTLTERGLEPRHVDLRPFAITSGDSVHVAPGGLTRVAFEAGALVVNSSQNGGSKDTWVLA